MKQQQILQLLLLTIFSTLLFIGCTNDQTALDTEPAEETTNEQATNAQFPLELTDSTGNKVILEQRPETIISLIPSNTEILFALGLDDEIIAVTENDTYPEAALEKDTVGDYEINVEKVISLSPDLVLAHASVAESSFDAFEQIKQADINVYFVSDAQTIEETYGSIEEIGKVTGMRDEAEDVIATMQVEFAKIRAIAETIPETEKRSVLFEISPEPEIFTAGHGTFFNELIEFVNAINAAGDLDGWAQIDPEAIIELNPDVILTIYGSYVDNAVKQVLTRDGFSEVQAIKNEQVFDIDEDIVSRPGPRLVEGARLIAESVYPSFFTE